jgi:hypothetical protein
VLAARRLSLLTLFAGLFVVVGALGHTGVTAVALAAWGSAWLHGVAALTLVTAVASNLFSNVPAVLLLAPLVAEAGAARSGFLTLAMASTLAGNLTVVGSVANLIVVESARKTGRDGRLLGLPAGRPADHAATLGIGGLLGSRRPADARWWAGDPPGALHPLHQASLVDAGVAHGAVDRVGLEQVAGARAQQVGDGSTSRVAGSSQRRARRARGSPACGREAAPHRVRFGSSAPSRCRPLRSLGVQAGEGHRRAVASMDEVRLLGATGRIAAPLEEAAGG